MGVKFMVKKRYVTLEWPLTPVEHRINPQPMSGGTCRYNTTYYSRLVAGHSVLIHSIGIKRRSFEGDAGMIPHSANPSLNAANGFSLRFPGRYCVGGIESLSICIC